MVNQIFPDSLSPEELDDFLAQGWYRMGQHLFTLDYIYLDDWIRVFWLRFRLKNHTFSPKHRQLIAKNKRFNYSISALDISEEHEDLYELYYKNIDFEASGSASEFLFGSDLFTTSAGNIFDSKMIEVRDGQKLIALGVFDLGKDCIAGILNFFHPDYKKYSLGKYLILKKIEFAQNLGLPWYYPGYIGHNFSKFDYKLFPGKDNAEIFEPFSKLWLPYSEKQVELLNNSQKYFFKLLPIDLNEAGI